MHQSVRYDLLSQLDAEGAMTDEIYVQMDKLLALCARDSESLFPDAGRTSVGTAESAGKAAGVIHLYRH